MSFYGQNFLDDFNMYTDYSNVDYTAVQCTPQHFGLSKAEEFHGKIN